MKLTRLGHTIKFIWEKILTICCLLITIAFLSWFIGGNIYNYLEKEQINQEVNNLTQELYQIKLIYNYKYGNVKLVEGKALISKPIYIELYPVNSQQTPRSTFFEFKQYFLDNGWVIDHERVYPNFYFMAKNERYLISMEWLSDERWVLIIRYNDFFNTYNL
ncbi:MAG: hypothetical protein LKF40_05610 [Megasphaera sp.]|jgi:hypothetical protein|nr:hypothetical protein [Megasphaera sp.]